MRAVCIRVSIYLCIAVMAAVGCAHATNPFVNPSFESGLSGWTTYSYFVPPEGDYGIPVTGTIGPGGVFNLIPPSYVPDGNIVCGYQTDESTANGGVCQSFYWAGGPATISVTARAYSEKYPQHGGGAYDNGCRVRMGIAPGTTTNRNNVSEWVTFPWGPEWATRSINISGAGIYTLFIEMYQPTATAIMSTLWDNVVWEVLPPVQCTAGPTAVIPGNPSYPDTTARIEWTTNVPSTSKVEYGLTSSYGQVVEDTQLKTQHSVLLTSLNNSSLYHFRASSSASGYATWRSDDTTFKTPIQFSDVSSGPGPDGLSYVVRWRTDVPTTSQVEYGEDTSYGNLTPENTELVTEHAVSISGLQEERTYHFRVWGRNRPNYSDAVSGDYILETLPAPSTSLANSSFELPHGQQSPSLYPWIQYSTIVEGIGYNPIDGLVGPYPKSGPLSWHAGIKAADGSYFVGAGSQLACKNGGVLQRVYASPGQMYTFGARYATYRVGGTNQDNYLRLGIDPNGGVDPESEDVQWWTTYSPTNDNRWHWATVTAQAGSGGVVTVFLDIRQLWPNSWNVVAVDKTKFGQPMVMSIGELKQTPDPLSAILENKIITHVDTDPVIYNGVPYTRAYIQDTDRKAGIAVLFDPWDPEQPQVTNLVTLTGSLVMNGMEASVVAMNPSFDRNPRELPKPVGLVQRALGGYAANQPELYARGGPSNIGLRVTVFGKVTYIDYENISFSEANAYIDDGSQLLDHQPEPPNEPIYGVRVKLIDNYTRRVRKGDYLAVTGVLKVPLVDPDEWPNTDDEFYAYEVVTASKEDWTILRAQ